MNYYEARKRASDNRWDWTCMNDGKIWKTGPCALHEDGHPTKIEAERHFYDHELSKLREVESAPRDMHQCDAPGCCTFAHKGYVGMKLFTETTWLCSLHLSRNVIPGIHPFSEGIEIWASW